MKSLPITMPMFLSLAIALSGCTLGARQAGVQAQLSDRQCRDLRDNRSGVPITHERAMSELAALEKAGYHPEWALETSYPSELEAAQRKVNEWYRTDCLHEEKKQ